MSSGSNECQPARKIMKNAKNFQLGWFEEFPSWREWVVTLADERRFHCKICNKTLLCGKSEIEKHEASLSHRKKQEFSNKQECYGLVSENSCNVTANSYSVDSCVASSSASDFTNSTIPESVTFKQKQNNDILFLISEIRSLFLSSRASGMEIF